MELSSGVTEGMNSSLHHQKWTCLPLDFPFFPKVYLLFFFHFHVCIANRKVKFVILDLNFILTALLIFLR